MGKLKLNIEIELPESEKSEALSFLMDNLEHPNGKEIGEYIASKISIYNTFITEIRSEREQEDLHHFITHFNEQTITTNIISTHD